jgi:hypothetical protein
MHEDITQGRKTSIRSVRDKEEQNHLALDTVYCLVSANNVTNVCAALFDQPNVHRKG